MIPKVILLKEVIIQPASISYDEPSHDSYSGMNHQLKQKIEQRIPEIDIDEDRNTVLEKENQMLKEENTEKIL